MVSIRETSECRTVVRRDVKFSARDRWYQSGYKTKGGIHGNIGRREGRGAEGKEAN